MNRVVDAGKDKIGIKKNDLKGTMENRKMVQQSRESLKKPPVTWLPTK